MSFEFAQAREDFPDDLTQIKITVTGVDLRELVRGGDLGLARYR